jgi:hypothetical protein
MLPAIWDLPEIAQSLGWFLIPLCVFFLQQQHAIVHPCRMFATKRSSKGS